MTARKHARSRTCGTCGGIAEHANNGKYICATCHPPHVPGHSRASPTAVEARVDRLYQALVDLAKGRRVCPSNEALAKTLGCSKSNVVDDCARLRQAGWIVVNIGGYRVVTICADGSQTARPARHETKAAGMAGRKKAIWKKRSGQTGDIRSDDMIYGDLADDIQYLRRRGWGVCKSETMGYGRGLYLLGNKLATPEDVRAKAARERRL